MNELMRNKGMVVNSSKDRRRKDPNVGFGDLLY
jgi:hypothetical protein